jgi:hypothetical protein
MSKKDYIVIANAIREAREAMEYPELRAGADAVAYRLANALKGDNFAFRATTFLDACGVPS